MHAEIRDKPSFANLHVRLEPGDQIIAEADAMASMDASIDMSTKWSGGAVQGILKRIFGGESMFVNTFTTSTGGDLTLTQPFPGDMQCIELNGNTMLPAAWRIHRVRTGRPSWGWDGLASRCLLLEKDSSG